MGDSIKGKSRKGSTENRMNRILQSLGDKTGFIGGRASITKSGKTQMLTLKVAGQFYSPEQILGAFMRDVFEKANRVNPVRLYPERVGELANLPDPAAQLRSVAALLVKKYHLASPSISTYYAAIRKRELLPEECHDVIAHASRLGKAEKDDGMMEWLRILERGGEDVRTNSRDEEDDLGAGEEDHGEPGAEA